MTVRVPVEVRAEGHKCIAMMTACFCRGLCRTAMHDHDDCACPRTGLCRTAMHDHDDCACSRRGLCRTAMHDHNDRVFPWRFVQDSNA